MTTQKKTKMEREAEQFALKKVGWQADALIKRLNLSPAIDPLRVAKEEYPFLRAGGRDFGNRFDGKLRYASDKKCFVLMYNTKYDAFCPPGKHHPRTRFSIAHELGHYFIEHHHAYLTHGGKTHASINEFRSNLMIEREADAFAASLLLPTHLISPIVNAQPLTYTRLRDVSDTFETSLVSTAIRSVQLSHFPCALAAIRNGAVAWMFPSEALIGAKIYPKKGHLPPNAVKAFAEFQVGLNTPTSADGHVPTWFANYNECFEDEYVAEEYIPVPIMDTLLVLLNVNEQVIDDAEEFDEE